MAPELCKRVAPGGWLVLSGVLVPQDNDVLGAYGSLRHVETLSDGDWTALVFERPER
jgi:ribosomal protein L11 methyltransferase